MIASVPQLVKSHGGEVTWSDFFCGAGGSSLGIHHVPGMVVKYALNHWDLAVQAHAANFQETDHEVTVIEAVHPSRFGRTDCAWFSPSCTAQAYCGPRGSDEDSVRSRATMMDVIRWTLFHKYDMVVVENVVEAKLWCDEAGHMTVVPDPKKPGKYKVKGCDCGRSYDLWIQGMVNAGYEYREVFFNSQHALVPQSRDRLYVVFWKKGMTAPDLDFAPPSYCSTCEDVRAGVQTWKKATKGGARDSERLFRWGRYGSNYIYGCPVCGDQVAPGVVGSHSIIDYSLPIETVGSRKKPIVEATRQRMKLGIERLGELQSVQLQVGGNLFERPGYARLWSLDDPLRTVTTSAYMAILLRYGGQAATPRLAGEPAMTLTAHDRQIGLMRFGNMGISAGGEPGPTITTSDDVGLLMANRTNATGGPLGQPTPTVTTAPANHMLMTMRKHGRVDPTAQPASTVAAGGMHHGYLAYNGNPGHIRALYDAAGTVKTRDSQSLIVPHQSGNVPSTTTEPMNTVKGRSSSALLEVTDDMIDAMHFRMLDWTELQRAQAMHALPDGSLYQLIARVRTKRGKFRDLNNEERVKMIGNAVSSPVAELIARSCAQALAA